MESHFLDQVWGRGFGSFASNTRTRACKSYEQNSRRNLASNTHAHAREEFSNDSAQARDEGKAQRVSLKNSFFHSRKITATNFSARSPLNTRKSLARYLPFRMRFYSFSGVLVRNLISIRKNPQSLISCGFGVCVGEWVGRDSNPQPTP